MQQVKDLCIKAFRLCTYRTWKDNFKAGDRVSYVFFGPDLIDPSGVLLHPKFRHVHLGYAWRDFSLMYTHNGQYVEPVEYDTNIARLAQIFKRKGWTVLRTEIKGKLNSSSIHGLDRTTV